MLLKFIKSLQHKNEKAFQFLQFSKITTLILTGILLIKLGISKLLIAQLEWNLFLIITFSFFWVNGFSKSFLNFYPSLNKKKQQNLHESKVFIFLFSSIFSYLLYCIFTSINLKPAFGNAWLFGFIYVLQVFSFIIELDCLIKNKPKRILLYSFLSYWLYPLVIVTCYLVNKNINSLLIGLLVMAIIRSLLFLPYLLEHSFKFNSQLSLRFFKFSIPLIVYFIFGKGMEIIDGLIVHHFFNTQDFVTFRYGARELPIFAILITSYLTALLPNGVKNLDKSLAKIRIHLSKLMNWLFPICSILLFLTPTLFKLAYSTDYVSSSTIFNTYLLILISRILAPDFVLLAKQKNHTLMKSLLLSFFVTLSLA